MDRLCLLGSLIGISSPPFWIGIAFILIFAVELRWFPSSGRGTWQHLVLPAASLSLYRLALFLRLIRAGMLDVMTQDFIRTARSKGVSEKLEDSFDSPFWDKIHQTCLACGICTFLCPTCHCFAFDDSRVDSKGERIRLWDCCQYPAFTLEASGHNPRISSRERMRQRIMHKFSYYVKNFGEVACVGCGRCVENCPINLDLREIVTIIKEDS